MNHKIIDEKNQLHPIHLQKQKMNIPATATTATAPIAKANTWVDGIFVDVTGAGAEKMIC